MSKSDFLYSDGPNQKVGAKYWLLEEAICSRLVLVVDDQDFIRRYLVASILQMGLAVIEAGDGIDGVEMARRYSPALVVMNGIMPHCDGFEATARLRAGGYDGLIFFATAFQEQEKAVRAIQSGADGFYSRPQDTERLLEDIKRALLYLPMRE